VPESNKLRRDLIDKDMPCIDRDREEETIDGGRSSIKLIIRLL
jgi:hypothetical protein